MPTPTKRKHCVMVTVKVPVPYDPKDYTTVEAAGKKAREVEKDIKEALGTASGLGPVETTTGMEMFTPAAEQAPST